MTQRLNRLTATAVITAVGSLASAQTGTLVWEASRDGGGTWQSGDIAINPGVDQDFKIRLVVGFSMQSAFFRDVAFDGVVRGAAPTDAVSNMQRWFTFAAQSLAATRFGDTIKIDDSRDLLEPGVGSRWTMPSQGITQFPDIRNPLVVFTYDLRLALSVSSETRTVSSVLSSSAPMRVWIPGGPIWPYGNSAIIQNVVQIDVRFVVPTPGSLVMLGLASLTATRRRR